MAPALQAGIRTPSVDRLCDRIYVMCGGRIAGEFGWEEVTPEKLLESALPRGSAVAQAVHPKEYLP